MRTVRHGHAPARRLLSPMARRHGLRRPTTTATARALLIAVAPTSRRNGITITTPLPTGTAAIRSRALTIPRLHARTQRREPILPRAATIRLRHAPTPPLAVATVAVVATVVVAAVVEVVAEALTVAEVVVEALTAVEAAEALTAAGAVEVPALTGGTNLFANSKARPLSPDGPFAFQYHLQVKFSEPHGLTRSNARGITPTQLFRPAGVR